ncbi:MAG: MBL fold metallo-hydrolase [Crenarchaeota archaeon]|nr:MBL fold metallo-hydrolase [Thermoproteota archaeon]MCR8454035.1 MBL fold metallo-hydrolase [Thermoproteota archaeon]MCR8463383.1 MBL fold metallo-hydrolase [Thermoproteota archaeon]MCR8470426.1 MBL fold metallo-hydrolase [Thermoproteota archaeon]MCR8471443.1 MBL fold metallo-hydrolase [Thermoproteota archaeon]
MEIYTIKTGILRTNTYVVVSKGEAVILDPGGEVNKILELAKNLRVRSIIATHGHFDHVLGVPDLKRTTGAEFLIHADDQDILEASWNLYGSGEVPKPDRYLQEGDIIRFGDAELRILHTPGHTPGSISLFDVSAGVIFTGDTLFRGAIGRTDFLGGDPKKILESVKRILEFPESFKVYPGHGQLTTIHDERKNLSSLLKMTF